MPDFVGIDVAVERDLKHRFGYLAKDVPQDERINLLLAIFGYEHHVLGSNARIQCAAQ